MNRSIRHPIETIRTAPVSFAAVAISLSTAAHYSYSALSSENLLASSTELACAALSVGSVVLNSVLAMGKIDLRNRLEATLERTGYNDRIMDMTTEQYCVRQAARIACENTGHLEEYQQLCEKNSEDAQFTWLPHA